MVLRTTRRTFPHGTVSQKTSEHKLDVTAGTTHPPSVVWHLHSCCCPAAPLPAVLCCKGPTDVDSSLDVYLCCVVTPSPLPDHAS